VAPNLDPDPVHGPRAEAGECSDVYDLYLRGKQLSRGLENRESGVELLREAVAIDDQCAIAWEAIALASVNWTMSGFAKAGAAARRALELNDSLPEAWAVLAEIAEEEQRWTDSEEFFLRALYADPTNGRANMMYGESLLARGRVKDGLRYSLEAYRYEPVYDFHVALAAKIAGDAELTFKHAALLAKRYGELSFFAVEAMAEGHLILGETEKAREQYQLINEENAPWFLECISARQHPDQWPDIAKALQVTFEQHQSGELNESQEMGWGWQMIRCGTWIGQTDLVFDMLLAADADVPTEARFFPLFFHDAGVLRQHPRFREMVTESGLLEYWQEWGWSDYCEPDGDSFRCD
jgi:tetratricopeptide (TPR) repeat protein